MKNILEDGRTGGYFVYPPLPRTLEDYNALFTPESPLDIIPPHSIARLIESMHVYQSIRVCIQGNIAAVEVVTGIYHFPGESLRKKNNKYLDVSFLKYTKNDEIIFVSEIVTKITSMSSFLYFHESIKKRIFRLFCNYICSYTLIF